MFRSCDDLVKSVTAAKEDRRPYSLIRLGDGEGYVMGYGGQSTGEEIEGIFRIWFGRDAPDVETARVLKEMLLNAVNSCDGLGLFAEGSKEPRFTRPFTLLRETPYLANKELYSADVHLELQDRGLFSYLLGGEASVGLLTCRDVCAECALAFSLEKVEWISIPEEAQYAGGDGPRGRHYPEYFNRLLHGLYPSFRGQIWLVGAGILGKIYCNILKNRGAIALDVGSVFDSWSRMTRRGSVKKHRQGV